MALPDTSGRRVAQGYNCFVRIKDSSGAIKSVGFCSSFNATENFSVQKATVLGHLGPIALDPQDYDCSISIAALVPSKDVLDSVNKYNEDVDITVDDIFSVAREDFMSANGIPNIEYLDFYNRKTGRIIAKFTGISITSNGIQGEGSTYVRKNIQLMAMDWPKK